MKEPHAGARRRTRMYILNARGDVESSDEDELPSDDELFGVSVECKYVLCLE